MLYIPLAVSNKKFITLPRERVFKKQTAMQRIELTDFFMA